MSKSELLAHIEADQSNHIAFLQEFIRAPSPNPPGDTREAASVVQRYLDAGKVEYDVVAPQCETPNIVSEFEAGTTGRRLVMNGHIDVFPAGDGLGWKRDPWSGDLVNGTIYGRGATDMKAGTAASIIAFTYLRKFRSVLSGSVGLTAVSDEETGGKWGSRWLLENDIRWRGDCMINAEPSGLQTIRFAEKGTLRLTFTIETEGAHGAYLHKTKSASRLAASLIQRLEALEALRPELPDTLRTHVAQPRVRDAIDAALGKGASEIIMQPTVNIGVIRGGLKVNMIPSHCVIEADIRLPIGLSQQCAWEEIEYILKDFPEAKVEIQEAASNPSSASPVDHPMVALLAKNAERFIGYRPVAVPSLGATDCKFWRYKDVPAYIYGPSPGRMASTNECVPVEEFLTVIKTHALAAWEYLGGQ